jgi:hypothetical protein
MQDNLIKRLLLIFSSEDGDNADLCLKMSCLDYIKNFFCDYQFKVDTYAHIVAPVVAQSSNMMRRLLKMGKPSIVNEVLQLYRFIVDKYSEKHPMLMHDNSG